MKLSNSFFYTIREDLKDEESVSGNLLVKSSMIKKYSSGTYAFMPMGLRVLEKIKNIVKEEMNNTGANEVLMPSLIHKEIYDKSGRSELFGSSTFKLNDRFDKPYILAPTHEELFAMAGKSKVKSYKDLPFNIYQFQNKFRDEPRPRFGLIRVREFLMKDAYSFDKDNEGLDVSYNKMYNAYKNIFNRLGLNYTIVKADTGVMGGMLSEEFQAITDIGEDTLVLCDSCDYSSNVEVAVCKKEEGIKEDLKDLEKVNTPNIKTIDELSKFLNIDKKKLLKCVIYKCDGELVACFVRGDKQVNEVKLTKVLDLNTEPEIVESSNLENVNTSVGFTGPINLNIKCIVDEDVLAMNNFVIGANEIDTHYINCNFKRDFDADVFDISNVLEGSKCPKCNGNIIFKKGIEVGNTFKLGTKYSEKFDLLYNDGNNNMLPVVMGSYGIGIGRLMAAIVEQNNDDKGIVWPEVISPYLVNIVLINSKDEVQNNMANELYDKLNKLGIDVMLDDRNERAGVKFKDSDLLGIPYRITVGKKAIDNIVEFKKRSEDEVAELSVNEVINKLGY